MKTDSLPDCIEGPGAFRRFFPFSQRGSRRYESEMMNLCRTATVSLMLAVVGCSPPEERTGLEKRTSPSEEAPKPPEPKPNWIISSEQNDMDGTVVTRLTTISTDRSGSLNVECEKGRLRVYVNTGD